ARKDPTLMEESRFWINAVGGHLYKVSEAAQRAGVASKLGTVADQLDAGTPPADQEIREYLRLRNQDAELFWPELSKLCLKLYGLYPYQGKEILTRGAVMPYYEFPWATRLTDGEWLKLLDSPEAPPNPAWITPIISKEKPTRGNYE